MTPLPRLYKYKRLDEKTVSLIVNRVIYFAGPNQFNDPFDCSLRYDLSGTEAEWRDYFARSLTELRPELAPEEAANMVDAQMREGAFRNTRFLKSISDDALRHQNERLGILSLTADPTNILMWSHYADAHRGCCLEFSTSAPVFKGAVNFRRAEHVKYAVEYPSVRFLDCVGKPDKHVEFTVLTKSDLWEYEEEWRITSLRGPGLYKFDELSLTGIICGHWMTEENVALLKGLVNCRKPKVRLCRAAPNGRQFAMKLLPLD